MAEYISRDAVLDILERYSDSGKTLRLPWFIPLVNDVRKIPTADVYTEEDVRSAYNDGYSAGMEQGKDINVPTADVQEWISVEDRLPDKDGFYNVVMDGDIWGEPGVKAATSCGFYDGKWDEDGATIYYWMPLPKPPKMDGGAE